MATEEEGKGKLEARGGVGLDAADAVDDHVEVGFGGEGREGGLDVGGLEAGEEAAVEVGGLKADDGGVDELEEAGFADGVGVGVGRGPWRREI